MSSEKELLKAKWLTSFASGQKWLEKIGSANTKKIFTDYFKRYCDYTKQTPDQLIALKVQGLQNVVVSYTLFRYSLFCFICKA